MISGVRTATVCLAIAIAVSLVQLRPCLKAAERESPSQPDFVEIEDKWGIRDIVIRLSANKAIVDVRYRITDGRKAEPFFDAKNQLKLVHQPTGRELPIATSKFGKLRQTPANPGAHRVYFALFSNRGGQVQSKDCVTLIMGDVRIENLEVE
jgi:hypothetical protein